MCLHFPLLVTLSYLRPKRPLLAAILRQQQAEKIIKNKDNNHNNTILYANIFIEVHWLKFLSNNQPPSTTETHSIIVHAIHLKKKTGWLHIWKHTEE